MATILGQINLMKFKGARRVSDGKTRGIFIPVDENPTIYDSGRGAYASVRIVEKASEFDGKKYTHFIALDLPKDKRDELREKLGDDAFRALTPILGNLREYQAPAADYTPTTLYVAGDHDQRLADANGFKEQHGDLPF